MLVELCTLEGQLGRGKTCASFAASLTQRSDSGGSAAVNDLAGHQRAALRTAYSLQASLGGVEGGDRFDESEGFQQSVQDALDSLPFDLRARMSNVAIVVADEPPPGQRLLGLYEGVPLTRRGSNYGGVLPDKITIYRGPLERLYGYDRKRLEQEIRRVVLHEVAHHFGISDQRLIDIDRY